MAQAQENISAQCKLLGETLEGGSSTDKEYEQSGEESQDDGEEAQKTVLSNQNKKGKTSEKASDVAAKAALPIISGSTARRRTLGGAENTINRVESPSQLPLSDEPDPVMNFDTDEDHRIGAQRFSNVSKNSSFETGMKKHH